MTDNTLLFNYCGKKIDIGYVLQQCCSFLSCGSFYKLNTLSLIYLEINVSSSFVGFIMLETIIIL